MAFTEFTCRSGGNNLYAGTRDGSAEAPVTPLVTYTNGGWNSGTGVFTPVSGNPSGTGVAVGDWISVYIDGASAPTGFVARVTAVTTTNITLSTTAKSGTAPTTAASGITAVVGGAWLGPNGASGFPYGFAATTMTNAAGDYPRVNFKNDAAYSITAAMVHSGLVGPLKFQGYTTTFGDGGRAVFDGGTSGASYVLLTTSSDGHFFDDLEFQNNGATGIAAATNFGSRTIIRRCVAHDVRGNGFAAAPTLINVRFIECEAYACNQSNTGALGGFSIAAGLRCNSHDNAGSNARGFTLSATNGTGSLIDCIADTNGGDGINVSGVTTQYLIQGCDCYNNGSDGLELSGSAATQTVIIENCNFLKNGGYGVNVSAALKGLGTLSNCGFGSGTQANTSGQTAGSGALDVSGAVTYAANVTPWVDPANGDFRINLAAAKGTGRGLFLQTQSGYAGTIAYPDIGAAQHQDTGGGGPTVVGYPLTGRG